MSTRSRLFLLGLFLMLFGCHAEEQVYRDQFVSMGTVFELTVYDIDESRGRELSRAIQKDLEYMNFAWHAWKPGSLGRVNQLLVTGGWFSINPSVLPLVEESKRLYQSSQGLFNPAIGALVRLWGFHSDDPGEGKAPTDAEINAFMQDVPTMDDIELDGIRARGHNPKLRLDFGAFAKGYALELLMDRLREMGVKDAIINAGGDLKTIGRHGDRPWRIAIRDPKLDGSVGNLEIEGATSVFTSGNYERYYQQAGKRYHHILDPRTGRPSRDTSSVTVVHDNAGDADAAATALFVAGPEQWWEIARSMGIKYVLLVDDEGNIHMNPAMSKRVRLEPKYKNAVKLSAPLN
ncbi:MAG: FAD:protein FMN transferase [Gammaproteobacteria bacterium]|nr:FAD:protein FMN transferase [Gammaproteobacteria bacterium]